MKVAVLDLMSLNRMTGWKTAEQFDWIFGESNFVFGLNFTGSDNLQHLHQKSAKFSWKKSKVSAQHAPLSHWVSNFFILGLFPRGAYKNVHFSELFCGSIFTVSLSKFTFRINNGISGHSQNHQQKKNIKKSLIRNYLRDFIFHFFLWLMKKFLNIFELLIKNWKQIWVAGSLWDVKKDFEFIFVRISGAQSTPTSQWHLPPFLS